MVDTRMFIEEKVQNDFDEFDLTDKPIKKYCVYNHTKHIQMATQIVLNCIELGNYISMRDIDDLIHGLNHIFFNGIAASQAFEWRKDKN